MVIKMKVKDIMSKNPLTVRSNASIENVSAIFNRVSYWALFIVDSGKLVGIVTRNDLRIRSQNHLLSDPISQIMSKGVFRIDTEAEVEQAISLLNYHGSNSLAVVNGDRLCGIVTRYDINTKYRPEDSSDEYQEEDSNLDNHEYPGAESHEQDNPDNKNSDNEPQEQEDQNNEDDHPGGLMKTCSRCHKDIGRVNGLLDGLFHATGNGLCRDCQSKSARDENKSYMECRENDENDPDSNEDPEPDNGGDCYQLNEEKPRKRARYPNPTDFAYFPQDSDVIPRVTRKRKGDFL